MGGRERTFVICDLQGLPLPGSVYSALANRLCQAASLWLLAGILQTRGPRDFAVLPGWPQLLPGGQGIMVTVHMAQLRPFLLSGLASAVSLPAHLLACSVSSTPCAESCPLPPVLRSHCSLDRSCPILPLLKGPCIGSLE